MKLHICRQTMIEPGSGKYTYAITCKLAATAEEMTQITQHKLENLWLTTIKDAKNQEIKVTVGKLYAGVGVNFTAAWEAFEWEAEFRSASERFSKYLYEIIGFNKDYQVELPTGLPAEVETAK